MLYVVRFDQQNGDIEMLFAYDTDSGTTAKDLLYVPGVVDNMLGRNTGLHVTLKKLDGSVGNYRTVGYGLVVQGDAAAYDNAELVSRMLTVPATAAQTLMSNLEPDLRSYVEYAMKAVTLYEQVTEGSKLCLPAESLKDIDPALAEKIMTSRKAYILKDVENQEIFQPDSCGEYGVQLPSLEAVHANPEEAISSLDLLRVAAPYRRQEASGYSYRSVYHTPYFKVDPRLRGMVPSYLEWITGYSSNDLLDIQANEQRMANNLYTFVCSDIARYVMTLVSGIFFDTALGSLLNRLCAKQSSEIAYELGEDIRNSCTDQVSCDIPSMELDALLNAGWYTNDIADTIKKHLVIKDGYLRELIMARPNDRRIIDCSVVPFTLNLTDDQEREFTELLIQNGFLSLQMRIFLVSLCKKAYRVNWGHTGAALAIPGFVDRSEVGNFDTIIGDFVRECIAGRPADNTMFPLLYPKNQADDDEDALFGDGSGEEIFSGFEYYITTDTMNRMINGSLPDSFFFEKASPAQSSEAAIVEYWRTINGENQLDNLLFHAYLNTCDPKIFIESFIKLMRWGERKPKLLVLQHHPEVRMVLDLNVGLMVDNTTLVDENDLVKVNGCDYSLESFLTTNSNPSVSPDQIIGFVLNKDYGNVKKKYLASWVDVGEMCASGNVNIGDFVLVKPLGDQLPRVSIEEFEKIEYQFYVSDNNIEAGLRYKIQPADLSALALLVQPGVSVSAPYLRSLKNQHIISSKDRQYDTLRRYLSVLKAFNDRCAAEGWNAKNTVQLKEMSLAFINLYQGEDTKGGANEATAHKSLSNMNFGNAPTMSWDTTPLEGKFILIIDKEMQSGLRPISFTDPALQNVAARTGNRVVLLLLQADGKYIFCRKNIKQSEVLLANVTGPDGKPKKNIAAKKFEMFASMFENLQRGATGAKISNLPAVLHESLQEVLQ